MVVSGDDDGDFGSMQREDCMHEAAGGSEWEWHNSDQAIKVGN
jgi:hypothetical protein